MDRFATRRIFSGAWCRFRNYVDGIVHAYQTRNLERGIGVEDESWVTVCKVDMFGADLILSKDPDQ